MGRFYYKVGQVLQSGQFYYKVGQLLVITKWDDFITKWDSFCYYKVGRFYYKVERVLQSGTTLLQSGTGITKWDDYYKVGFNIRDQSASWPVALYDFRLALVSL